jgi:antitoxin (DNA-binding transcriptional repressor) of toxin-antitoxin stability system
LSSGAPHSPIGCGAGFEESARLVFYNPGRALKGGTAGASPALGAKGEGLCDVRSGVMTTISIEEAQAKLPDLIHRLHSGDDVVITENDQPVARLVHTAAETLLKPRQPGILRGSVVYMAPDFDAPLEDFREYME